MPRPALLAAVLLLIAVPAAAADMVPLAAHRALYRMTLDKSRSGDVVGATGTMGYEVIDACDGWAVRQRLDMNILNNDGQNIEIVSDYATWESKDGLRFRFHMRQTTEGAVISQTDGNATLTHPGGPGEAHYTTPKVTTVALPPGTLFPMAHTAALLAAAAAGQKHLALPLFDGTDENGAQNSSIVVTDWQPPAPTQWPLLSKLPSAHVHIAFFGPDSDKMIPDYEVSMRYWANGVADDLRMDFGDFVMDAKLTDFALQPRRC
ncbi:MAG TPA: cell envelope integrity EipB family protein [Acetobacteraceae bacterium]|nr:cell envelope integrity EipB family protein [Acetobacteraceae bacterium]